MTTNEHSGASVLRAPLDFLAWLGACGLTVLLAVPAGAVKLAGAAARFLRDVLHGLLRILRWLKRLLLTPVKLHAQTAERVYRVWENAEGKSLPARIAALLQMAALTLFSEHGILLPFLRFAAPALCCALLFAVVRYGAGLDYIIAVDYQGTPIGYIENEADYTKAEQIVMQRLSYTDDEYDISFGRSFQLVLSDGTEACLSAGELADQMLQRSDISLCSGFGVYVGDTFYGTVEDIEPIRHALAKQLSDYSDRLGGEIKNIRYAKEIRYEPGTYLAQNLTDAAAIARQLTKTEITARSYTTRTGDTIYGIANRYTVTPDELRYHNPELPDIPAAGTRISVPVTRHAIPIIFEKYTDVTSFIDYDTVEIETMTLPIGTRKVLTPGIRGEKLNYVRITYTDGAESARYVINTHLIEEPVNEEIGIGIYQAAPFSTKTVMLGSGRFSWPLDGGWVSDPFGAGRNHGGIDLAAPAGTNIYAADDGVVTVSRLSPSYGYYIIIDHGDGFQTLYAHCSLLIAAVGQEVKRGQCIALVGTTGNSTGNHLHFEVRVDGMRFDPALFLRVNAGDGDETG